MNEQTEQRQSGNIFRKMLEDMKRDFKDNSAAIRENEERIEREERAERIRAAVREFDMLRLPEWWTAAGFRADNYPAIRALFTRAEREKPFSMLIMGPTKSGKSHAGTAFGRIYAARGYRVFRVTEPELAAMFELKDPDLSHMIQKMRSADVLIIDDVGKQETAQGLKLTRFGMLIFSVFDSRAERRRPTIVTTRHNRDTLTTVLGGDLVRRMLLEEDAPGRAAEIEYKKAVQQ